MKKQDPHAKPTSFALEIGDAKLSKEEIDKIQNSLAKNLVESVRALGKKATVTWVSFGQWGSFGQAR